MSRLLRTYGITEKQYNALLKQQHGRCAICNALPKKKRLSVDHDHKTGFVRGLLCTNCNRAIGYLRDRVDLAEKSAKYLFNAIVEFSKLSIEEQQAWLPFAGRSSGKGRRKRIRKAKAKSREKSPKPRLPRTEEPEWML